MTQTVVAVFNSYSAAQQAAQHLSGRGVAEGAVHVTEEDSVEDDPLAYDDPSRQGIRGFFAELFSSNDYIDDLARYKSAMRRGAALVTVNVDNEDDIEAIEQVLSEAGAINIDEEWSLDVGAAGAPASLRNSPLESDARLTADTGGASVGGRASVQQLTPEAASNSARLGSAEQDLVERNASGLDVPQSHPAQDQAVDAQSASLGERGGVRVYPRRSDI